MPENRKYAGPHDAVELAVTDDSYVLVVRDDLSDEQAAALGYTFDGDEAVATGRSLARRTITVSDELAAKLDRATFVNEAGESVPSWPKSGGKPAEQTVDVPELNPATMPVTLDSGEVVSSADADERAYASAQAEEVAEREAIERAGQGDDVNAQKRARVAQIDERIEAIEKALDGTVDDDEAEALHDEHDRLTAEREDITKALGAGKGA